MRRLWSGGMRRTIATAVAAMAGVAAAVAVAPGIAQANPYDRCGGFFGIRASNGKYLSTELGYQKSALVYGMVRARATTIGSWEVFRFCHIAGQSADRFALTSLEASLTSGKSVATPISAEFWDEWAADSDLAKFYGMLRSRFQNTTVGQWETFEVYTASGTGPMGTATFSFSLASIRGDQFVAAEIGGTPPYEDPNAYAGLLRARSYEIGSWEKFVAVPWTG
jgi:hypothetical protein